MGEGTRDCWGWSTALQRQWNTARQFGEGDREREGEGRGVREGAGGREKGRRRGMKEIVQYMVFGEGDQNLIAAQFTKTIQEIRTCQGAGGGVDRLPEL